MASNLKECSKCKKELPATTEFFWKRKGDSLMARCKECIANDRRERKAHYVEYYKKYRKNDKETSGWETFVGSRICSICKRDLALDSFYYCRNTVDRRQPVCKECYPIKNRELRYNISNDTYISLLNKQENVCAICGEPETRILRGKLAPLCVDHNHETGEIRGLLCSSCNRAIGYLRDNPSLADKLSNYLRKDS